MNIAHVAALANLDLEPAEAASLERDLQAILEYVNLLGTIDTAGVEPMTRVPAGEEAQAQESPWREDEARSWFSAQQALANAPAARAEMFQVPRIVDRG